MRKLTVVVGGLPGLDSKLQATGYFQNVYRVDSVGQFRDLTGKELAGIGKDDIVLLFADNLTDDLPGVSFDRILSGLSTWKVVLVSRTANGRALASRHPSCGLLDPPISVNFILAAISGTAGVGLLDPVPDGGEVIDFDAPQGVQNAGGQAPPAGAWTTLPPAEPALETPPGQAPAATAGGAQTGGAWSTPAASGNDAPSAGASDGEPARPASTWESTPPPAWTQALQETPRESEPARPPLSAWQTAAEQAAHKTVGTLSAATLETPPLRPPAGAGLRPPTGGAGPAPRMGSQPDRVRERGAERRGWVITVTAPKGGVGKSSLSLNMAVALALRLKNEGKRVCLVDANFQQADAAKYLGVYNAPTVVDLARDKTLRTKDRIWGALAEVPQYNLWALLGPASTIEADPSFINARLYNEIIAVLRENFDFIIVDTPVAERYHDIHAEFAVPAADFIVVAAIPSYQALLNINRWLRETICAPKSAGGMGVANERVGVVLNRAEEDIDCTEEDVQQELGSWKFLGAIPESREWKRFNNRHQVIAAAGFADLNEALRRVLYASTIDYDNRIDEPSLRPGAAAAPGRKKGLLGKLFKKDG